MSATHSQKMCVRTCTHTHTGAHSARTHTHAHAEQRGTMSRTSQWSSPGPTAGRDESNGPSALGSLCPSCKVPEGPEQPPAGPCCSSKVEGTEPRGPPPASMVRCEVLRLAHLSHHVQRTKRSSRRACGDARPSPAATGERAEFRQGYAAFKGQGASQQVGGRDGTELGQILCIPAARSEGGQPTAPHLLGNAGARGPPGPTQSESALISFLG